MNNFKVGDRVEVIAADMAYGSYKNGDILTIKTVGKSSLWMEEFDSPYVRAREVRHVTPAPDVITIPRAELPEVVEERGVMVAGGRDFGTFLNAAQHRKTALAQLAVSEFLATREKAEQDAADKHAAILNKRRDELAKEFCGMDVEYENFHDSTKALIDYAIQLEGKVKK